MSRDSWSVLVRMRVTLLKRAALDEFKLVRCCLLFKLDEQSVKNFGGPQRLGTEFGPSEQLYLGIQSYLCLTQSQDTTRRTQRCLDRSRGAEGVFFFSSNQSCLEGREITTFCFVHSVGKQLRNVSELGDALRGYGPHAHFPFSLPNVDP